MKNVTNYKNCASHPAEQKPIEIINLTNIDGEKLPEKYPILPGEKFVPEN